MITLSDKEKIEPKIQEISTLDKTELKELYRQLRKNGKNKRKKPMILFISRQI